jgi:hypothetical protein
MPTALLPARSPLMSVRNLASARLQMTALFGSPALCPQQSSWSNPLYQVRSSSHQAARGPQDLPRCQHFYEVLFGRPTFFALP